MTDIRTRLPLDLLKLLDLSIVVVSFGLATVVFIDEQHLRPLDFLSIRAKVSNLLLFIFILYIYHVIFRAFGLYQSRRLSRRASELLDILGATTVALVCFIVIGWLFFVRMLTVSFVIAFWSASAVLVSCSRMALRMALARIRAHGRNLRYLLIIGTNPRAVAFARTLSERPGLGYRLLGFVDDEWSGLASFRNSNFPLVCDCKGLTEFLRRNIVDEVVVYLPFASFYQHLSGVATLCSQHGITVRLNADVFGLANARWLSEEVGDGHYIATHTRVGGEWALVAKRLFDIGISSLLLLALAPLLFAVAVAIKLTSPGPVLFLQERIGLSKRRFKICKFRTMVPNAEKLLALLESRNEASGPVFKIKRDPRITPIGRFLRRSSIDELPQLLNVLKGDMSLVGPRPLPVRDYEGFSEDWQRRRFSVKPGITCLWQVNGRSQISFDQWMRLDMQYMDEWSIWLDFKILAMTVPAVLRGQGAA